MSLPQFPRSALCTASRTKTTWDTIPRCGRPTSPTRSVRVCFMASFAFSCSPHVVCAHVFGVVWCVTGHACVCQRRRQRCHRRRSRGCASPSTSCFFVNRSEWCLPLPLQLGSAGAHLATSVRPTNVALVSPIRRLERHRTPIELRRFCRVANRTRLPPGSATLPRPLPAARL